MVRKKFFYLIHIHISLKKCCSFLAIRLIHSDTQPNESRGGHFPPRQKSTGGTIFCVPPVKNQRGGQLFVSPPSKTNKGDVFLCPPPSKTNGGEHFFCLCVLLIKKKRGRHFCVPRQKLGGETLFSPLLLSPEGFMSSRL